jgi:hypothetical protein
MTNTSEIFVRLLDEGVDVWRPVRTERAGGGVYRILEQDYDREIEKWEFEPGERVTCELVDSSDGPILAAVAGIREDSTP